MNIMHNGIRVLHVEDDPGYQEMFQLRMERIAKRNEAELFSFDAATSVEKACQKLDSCRYDCIVCDYQIIGGTGLDVLAYMKGADMDIPFIFHTGQGDENVAREAFLRGASDYFTKDVGPAGYEWLYNAICVHIRHSRLHRKKEMAEARYHTIFDTADIGLLLFDENMRILMANSKMGELLGHTKEELEAGMSWTRFVLDSDLHRLLRKKRARLDAGGDCSCEHDIQIVGGNGKRRDVKLFVRTIPGTRESIASVLDVSRSVMMKKRIRRQNRILGAIRDVNQLITKEKDMQALLDGACELLVGAGGYLSAWMILFDTCGNVAMHSESGIGYAFGLVLERIGSGEDPPCVAGAMSRKGSFVTIDTMNECHGCPLSDTIGEKGAMTASLVYGSEVYGLLSVSVPQTFIEEDGERELFEELAADISFAVYKIRMEEQRMSTRDALEEKNRELQMILDSSTDMIYYKDLEGRILMANKKFLEFFGKTKGEIEGRSTSELYPKDITERMLADDMAVISSGEPKKDIVEQYAQDDIPRWARTSKMPLRDATGAIVGIAGFSVDITEQKRAQDELLMSEARYRMLFENMSDGVAVHRMVCDENKIPIDYVIELINPAAERILSFYKMDVEGKKASDVYGDIPFLERYADVALTGNPQSFTDYYHGHNKWYEISTICPSFGYFITIFRDVTKRKNMEDLHCRQREELSEFAHSTAHDIRNPLQIIRGYAEVLMESDGTGICKKIVEQADAIDAFVRYSLHLADAGKVIGSMEKLDVNELVSKVASKTVPGGIRFSADRIPKLKCDYHRLQQVFQNLFINAVEHGEPEMIWVGYKEDDGWAVLTVGDDGKGIPSSCIDCVFDKGHTSTQGGTGMGLAIVKRIVEARGGSISVESVRGSKTVFTIRIPLEP